MRNESFHNKFLEQEKQFLIKLDPEDYIPLNNVVRIFSGYDRWATEEDYLNTLEFIRYLLSKYGTRLKCYIGPGVKLIQKEPEEFIAWLKEMWYTGEYKEKHMDYSIWFDLEPLEQEEEN